MAKLNVDTKLIETLAQLLQRTGLTEIEVAEGEARIRVAREPQPVVATVPPPAAPARGQRPRSRPTRRRRPRPRRGMRPIRAPCKRPWSARSI